MNAARCERRILRDAAGEAVRGRFFTESDDASKPLVVVINEALAKKYFPGEDPIGKRIGDTQLTPKSMRTIVGVVDDLQGGRAR